MSYQGRFALWSHCSVVALVVLALVLGLGVNPVYSHGARVSATTLQQKSTAKPIVVGSKEYTESVLVGKMLVLLLREAGYEVDDQTGYGGTIAVREALEGGSIDLYQEFTGMALTAFHKLPAAALPKESDKSYELAKGLDADQGITWLKLNNYQTSFSVAVGASAGAAKLESLTDLAKAMNSTVAPLTLCIWDEFYGLENNGLAALQEAYDFTLPEEKILIGDLTTTIEGLHHEQCDVAIGTFSSGNLAAWGFRILSDPLGFFPTYAAAPTIRNEVLDANPKLVEILEPLAELLTNDVISQLNARIDTGADGEPHSGDEEDPVQVATDFLRNVGLIKLPTLVVGSKEYTESVLVGKMLVLLLREAGYEVDDQTGYGGTIAVREALEGGEIDLYPELTGMALTTFHNLPAAALPKEVDKSYELAKGLDADQGITWLKLNDYQTSFAVVVGASAAAAKLESLEDLAKAMNSTATPLTVCSWDEFYGLANSGLADLQAAYDFNIPEEKILISDLTETYLGLREGKCDVAIGTLTDGRVAAWGFRVLSDPRGFFPNYAVAPTIRNEILAANPKVAEVLDPLGELLTNDVISQLNARIDIGADSEPNSGDEEDPLDVAYRFLRSKRLVRPPTITVGSMNYTEELILGKILALVLQDAGYPVVDKTGLGDAKRVRQALESSEIDLYMEFNGTALSAYHKLPINALPNDPDRAYSLAKSLDEKKGIIWLRRSTYNNTYALKVRDDLWEQGIQSIEDLATFMNANDAPFSICLEDNFANRKIDGLTGLERRYGFQFKPDNVRTMELNEVYEKLRNQECDIAQGYSTDGRGAAWGFHNLADSLAFFPVYNVSPIVRRPVLETNPDLAELLNRFMPLLDDTTMSELNARVDIGPDGEFDTGDEEWPEVVARSFLESAGLIKLTKLSEQIDLSGLALEAGFSFTDTRGITATTAVSLTEAVTATGQ